MNYGIFVNNLLVVSSAEIEGITTLENCVSAG